MNDTARPKEHTPNGHT